MGVGPSRTYNHVQHGPYSTRHGPRGRHRRSGSLNAAPPGHSLVPLAFDGYAPIATIQPAPSTTAPSFFGVPPVSSAPFRPSVSSQPPAPVGHSVPPVPPASVRPSVPARPECSLELGRRHFAVDRTLASGSFGTVSIACTTSTTCDTSTTSSASTTPTCKTDCAYVVKKSACPSAAALESFHTELRIFERLNDTGLTPHVYGGFVCSHADDAARFPVPWSYLFLERMDGNLTEWVERTGTLPVDVVVRVFELVQRMHTHGVIHRDLHLSNVLYRHGAQADPHLFLTDFGNSYEIRRVRDSDEMVPRRNNFLFGAPEATVRDAMLYDYYTVVKSLAMMGFDVHCRHPLIDGSTHITERFPTRRTFDVAFVVNDQSHEERVESDSVLDAARQAFERRPSASLVVIGAKMFTEKPFVGHAIALDFDFERAVDRSLRALHTLRTLHADRP